ncbi:ion channel [Zhihengliuella sp.]|uniref:potassium channel family protein n=1 Tax=Zhihengliuella sp. TaxID=1954483 RepID=UPI0028127A5A|nr:ion channel [Zhihengliuella sp.]
MDVLCTVAGLGLVLFGAVDMFQTLLRPTGQGRTSRFVLRGVWRISKGLGHRLGSAVGPVAMVLVICLWVMLIALGWALVYLPHLPEGFVVGSGLDPSDYSGLADALYVSVVALSTLGYGDVVPVDPWLQVVAPLEALSGFAVLTAALTWFTQIYPPLSRRRSLAVKLSGLDRTGAAETIPRLEADGLARLLEGLADEIGRVRVDFAQHPEAFYFQEASSDLSLAGVLPCALGIRDAASPRPEPSVQLAARQLDFTLEQLAEILRREFFQSAETTEEVFAAYAESTALG